MNITYKLRKKLLNTISKYRMINTGDVIVAGISGGPDSVCMLDGLVALKDRLKIDILVAHYEHGLRKWEDERETQFVRTLARKYNLNFESEKGNLSSRGSLSSIEEKARDARYGFLESLKEKYNADKIALAHTMNDQAETVLMRLLRGSGIKGLSGIPPVRGHIIRPLIEIKREEVLKYLSDRNLSYVFDSSNIDTRFLRNSIRLKLLPELENYQKKTVERLAKLSDILREDSEFLEKLGDKWLSENAIQKNHQTIILPADKFMLLETPIKKRVVQRAISSIHGGLRRINSTHIESAIELVNKNKGHLELTLPGRIIIKKQYEELIFTKEKSDPELSFSYNINSPGTYHIKEIQKNISFSMIKDYKSKTNKSAMLHKNNLIDADLIEFPLELRNPRPGDRFVPLGMKGHKKIKDLFIDLKIPKSERKRTPIVLHSGEIVCVVGIRISERFKIREETENILEISIC